jgi:glycine/D-amino acid oxidase-like deaminating enzyme
MGSQAEVIVIGGGIVGLSTALALTRGDSDRDHVRRFLGTLKREGANVTLRDTRGQDIDAVCGQLRLRVETK